MVELLRHLGWQKFHLVGLSMGGMIALELAFMVLDNLHSLTLMVTHAGGFTAITPVRRAFNEFFNILRRLIGHF